MCPSSAIHVSQLKKSLSLPSTLQSLIAPAETSIGQKLLRQLGWRPGQGIGPRVSLRKSRIQEGKLGRLGTNVTEDDVGEAEARKHTFAPRDTKLLVFEGKDDRQGLGYERGSGMGSLAGSSTRSELSCYLKNSMTLIIHPASAFGAARRPEIDEDESPYAETSNSSRRFAFGDEDDDADDVFMVGGSKTAGERQRPRDDRGTGDRWHDGRPVSTGFALDAKGVAPDKWYSPI